MNTDTGAARKYPAHDAAGRIMQAILCVAVVAMAAGTDPVHSAPAFQPVEVVESSEQPIIKDLRVTGTVTSPRAAMLSPSIGGLVERFAVDAGDVVKTGDLLVQLDSELETLALQRARAAAAEAGAALRDARRRLAEAERLGSERGIAESEVKSRRAEVERLEAALQAAEADAAHQQAVLRRHEIHAPFDGAIGRRMAEAGEWVSPGDSVLELVATDGLRFDFRVPQEYFPRITHDTEVILRLDALPDWKLDGDIQAIVPVSDPAARTFLLRAIPVGDEEVRMTPGMSARATLKIDTGRTATVVPRDAVLRYPVGRTTVWVIDNSGDELHATEHRIETGLEFDGMVEVRSGLDDGMRVVTRGNESLQENQPVRIQ